MLHRRKPGMKTEIRSRFLVLPVLTGTLVLSVLISLAAPASGSQMAPKKPKEYAEGIQAVQLEDWKKAVDKMTKALEKQEEDGARTRIYGTLYEDYLPRFYLGFAFYKLNNCPTALEHWNKSEGLGYVKRKEEYNLLLRYRDICQKRLSAASTKVVVPTKGQSSPPLP
jgi:hypothetical protein